MLINPDATNSNANEVNTNANDNTSANANTKAAYATAAHVNANANANASAANNSYYNAATANANAHKHGKNQQLVQHQRCTGILEILHQLIESIFIRLQPVGYSDGFSNGYNFSGRTDVGKKTSPTCNHNLLIRNDMKSEESNSCPLQQL